jgi:hypothetical protein
MTTRCDGFGLFPLVSAGTEQLYRFPRLLFVLYLAIACTAQQAPPPQSPASDHTVTLPAGTRLALVLVQPLNSKTARRGDQISAQTSSPVTVGGQLAIPPGTFVQGKLEKVVRHGTQGEIALASAAVVFANGYIVNVAGPVTLESDEGTTWANPTSREKAGMIIAPVAGLGIGAGIGAAAHTSESSTLGGNTITTNSPKGLAIGSVVGLAAGGAVALILLARSHSYYVLAGSPVQMSLPQPITLAESQIDDGASRAAPALGDQPGPQADPANRGQNSSTITSASAKAR